MDVESGSLAESGRVEAIYVAPAAGAAMLAVPQVRAVPGKGLEGDRYFKARGTYSRVRKPGRQVTLVEAEALEALERDFGIRLPPDQARRNLVTRGVRLNDLVGREFRVGPAVLVGTDVCEPCAHLARLAGRDVLRGLVHRGGLRADILVEGLIQPGDRVEVAPLAAPPAPDR
jgi:MOSC domain-containing protein YiiM